MFKKILVVTDFSPNSLKVMSPALALAKKFDGTIYLCHVDEEEAALSDHSSQGLVDFLEHVESKRNAWLESLANEIREREITCEIVRLKGWASREILDYARAEKMDLTCISALGGQGFKALLMGSTSANVLRAAKQPTLFVSANCVPADTTTIKTVLYPTDFSKTSLRGAGYAACLCRELGATLEVFHVMKIPTFIPALPGEPPLVLPNSLLKKMDAKFEDLLEGLEEDISMETITCEVATASDEAEAIAAAAVAKKADLIIIPKRGHGVLAEMVFGRVAENVAKLAPVPTLLFHPDEVLR
jgi:nucleotide-binding universal stress UspA family protein